MDKKRKTFLSYSRFNKDFALKLAKELKAEGFSVWLDQLDIPLGARWDVEVEKALTQSDVFMVIITKSSSSSENVLDEISYAIDNGKRILPVLLEKTNLPLRLRRFQYVDFTDKSFDDGVQSAKELLRTLIEQPTVPQEASSDQPPQKETTENPGLTTTSTLRREKLEQELRFKAQEAKLQQEKADLEKQLHEERSTQDRMNAVAVKSRNRGYVTFSVFGIVVLALAISGFLITKLLPGAFFPGAPQSTEIIPPSTTEALIPLTSGKLLTQTQEALIVTEVPATEIASETPTQIPTETLTTTLSTEMVDARGVEMVLVEEGDFQMGSNKGAPDEQPVHSVFLGAFYIDKYEVTNGLYKACVDDGQCKPPIHNFFFPESPTRAYYGNPDYDHYPVIYVDWNMANAYCHWRGARLPTEAEWEKAARGTNAGTYPWGSGLDCQKANHQHCVNRTSEVGSYADGISPFGAYDMAGNVAEWVSDWYSDNYYSTSVRKNPTGPITGQSRVLRGGSWPKYDVTTFHRIKFAPEYNTFDIGFRCAVSP